MQVLNSDEAAVLPPLYAHWVDELLPGPIPREHRATCERCAMCAPPEDPEPLAPGWFHPDMKCCATEPDLPNFLVGRVLRDPEARDGHASVRARLRAGAGVGPLGLAPTKKGDLLRWSAIPAAHGRALAFRCPHYVVDGGTCGVWKHREARCTTYFCKHVRGAVGYEFWDALYGLLRAVERDLARWCAFELDLGPYALAALTEELMAPQGRPALLDEHDLDGHADADAGLRRWGRWWGREEAFYEACAARVEALSWEEVLARTGPLVKMTARVAVQAWQRLLRPQLPAALRLGELEIQGLDPDGVRIATYSRTDALVLPPLLLGLLPRFDGSPVEEVVLRIREEENVEIEAELLQRLHDFGVLVGATR